MKCGISSSIGGASSVFGAVVDTLVLHGVEEACRSEHACQMELALKCSWSFDPHEWT